MIRLDHLINLLALTAAVCVAAGHAYLGGLIGLLLIQILKELE